MPYRKTILAAASITIAQGVSAAHAQDAPSAPPPAKTAPLQTGAKPATEMHPDGEAATAEKATRASRARKPKRK